MPSKLRTSSLTTARTKPGTSVSIAVSRIAGINVPCVTVVEGLLIGWACAGAPPTPPIRLANSAAEPAPGLVAGALAVNASPAGTSTVLAAALASNTIVGLE